jgi:hypothetical protein
MIAPAFFRLHAFQDRGSENGDGCGLDTMGPTSPISLKSWEAWLIF